MSRIAEVLQEMRGEQARLRMELARVERTIAALEEAVGAGGGGAGDGGRGTGSEAGGTGSEAGGTGSEAGAPRVEVQKAPEPAARVIGPYSGFSIIMAVLEYLGSANEGKTTQEIADALVAGGIETKSANFVAAVRTTLNRGRLEGIERDEEGKWRLQERRNRSPELQRT